MLANSLRLRFIQQHHPIIHEVKFNSRSTKILLKASLVILNNVVKNVFEIINSWRKWHVSLCSHHSPHQWPRAVRYNDNPPYVADSGIRNPIVKIRRSWDRLIFIMGVPIMVRRPLYIEKTLVLLGQIMDTNITDNYLSDSAFHCHQDLSNSLYSELNHYCKYAVFIILIFKIWIHFFKKIYAISFLSLHLTGHWD